MSTDTARAAQWLSRAARTPETALARWQSGELVPLLAGKAWDVIEAEFVLARQAITLLAEAGHHVGPHLASGAERIICFLVPLGSAYQLADTPGTTVHHTGWPLFAPPPGRYVGDYTWVIPSVPIDGDGPPPWTRLTRAMPLRDALATAYKQTPRRRAGTD
ncbi:hypothetical protein [Streptomyces sp. NPDC001404]|uniref:hypothetical protein n=1 Tax=Streptomyces sp. NPDC001404 TaxID=3364571 RepID=UPI00369ACBFA